MSETFAWTPDMSVGVALIDDQHKEMFKRFNQLREAVQAGRGEEELGKIIEFAAEYVYFHFRAEEEVMKTHEYPGYAGHKKVHDGFVLDLANIMKEFEAGDNDAQLVIKVTNRLGDWIRQHIEKMDKELGEYISSKT